MSNNVIRQMQEELDKTRHELTYKHNKLVELQSIQQDLEDANTTIRRLQQELAEQQEKVKTEATVRAKEQIEALTAENEQLKKEAVAQADLLQQTGDELKECVQRVIQAEAHMKHMAAEHQAPQPVKTYSKDKIRKSQR